MVGGKRYGGKDDEMQRFLDLPRDSVVPLELALSGEAPHDDLRARGWRTLDAFEVSSTPSAYRDYLARSLGEWSVAKHAYVASRSGWFSCRSACYLALGVPTIVEDTGFVVPSGSGVLRSARRRRRGRRSSSLTRSRSVTARQRSSWRMRTSTRTTCCGGCSMTHCRARRAAEAISTQAGRMRSPHPRPPPGSP